MQTLIRQLRQAKRLSISELARRSGVSRATIMRAENEYFFPRAETLDKLAAALGTTARRLIK